MLVIGVLLFTSCNQKKRDSPAPFTVLHAEQTGLSFANKLVPTDSMNMFTYMYFYNGSGVGAGDFNQDGKVDLFFASNQGDNKLYLNDGDMKFTDHSKAAGIPQDGGWSTGVSVVDINDDGMLDIYVCRVGRFQGMRSHNQLLVCKTIRNGVPEFEERAAMFGLDFSGFSTQAVFFDMDRDNDLDLFLLNHAVHQNGSFAPREQFLGTYDSLSGDRLFKNEKGNFMDVTRESGINSSAIGYGLGVVASDLNNDGWPDLYIGNDFHENDYLYINQGNGRFLEEGEKRLRHTSQFSMGVDAADINQDGSPEIISADMLPSDPYILKRSLGEDDYDVFYHKISVGYSYQYTRNNLQYNRGNGYFSEIGLYAGVYATDWSWSPLWMDFDNDGRRDLFVSNGIPKRMNDIDYVSFVSNKQVQQDLHEGKTQEAISLANRFPEIKISNNFFHQQQDLRFEDWSTSVEGNGPSYSNGAIYADLDNDGDLDIVVSNIEDPVQVYRNNTDQPETSVDIQLQGPTGNRQAIGARVLVYAGKELRSYEKFPVHGFASSMEVPLQIGIRQTRIDSVLLIWPNGGYQPIQWDSLGKTISVAFSDSLPVFAFNRLAIGEDTTLIPWTDITAQSGLNHWHKENPFPEFNREPLLPHLLSTEGPALAVADINGDALEDFFIGGSRRNPGAVYIQDAKGQFKALPQSALLLDSLYEDVDAVWTDINRDGFPDLIAASGGNEYFGQDKHLLPRVYINNGKGNLTRMPDAIQGIYTTQSCIAASDFNGDGYMDLFLGGRTIPWEYGDIPHSYLLQNDGKGRFVDVTTKYIDTSRLYGMVTDVEWVDWDNDGQNDIILSYEWGGVKAFLFKKDRFEERILTDRKGWWNSLYVDDLDGDQDLDLLVGNLGLNSRLTASREEPVRLYYSDFDGNGKREQVLTYYLAGRELPFANKDELERQIPLLKKKYLYAEDFAKAGLNDLFPPEKRKKGLTWEADYFSNAVLINEQGRETRLEALPWQAQWTPVRAAGVFYTKDSANKRYFITGNYEGNNIQMGRYDAGMGAVLARGANGLWNSGPLRGMDIPYQVRQIRKIHIGAEQKEAMLLAVNDGPLKLYSIR